MYVQLIVFYVYILIGVHLTYLMSNLYCNFTVGGKRSQAGFRALFTRHKMADWQIVLYNVKVFLPISISETGFRSA